MKSKSYLRVYGQMSLYWKVISVQDCIFSVISPASLHQYQKAGLSPKAPEERSYLKQNQQPKNSSANKFPMPSNN